MTPSIVVNVSDARASADPCAVIGTYSLGSCVGVSVYDSAARVGGLLHFQLPAAPDKARAAEHPLMFADTGFEQLIAQVQALGAQKRRLKVKLAGAAQILDDGGFFNIGKRNHAAIRKVLWRHGLFVDAEDIGGETPRNFYLAIADGQATVKIGSTERTV